MYYLLKKFKIVFVGLLFGTLFVFFVTRGAATEGWSEDWETPPYDDWRFDGYYLDPDDGMEYNESIEPTVVEGVLKTNSPSDTFGVYWSSASRNSSVAYGTWSFDWVIEPGIEHESLIFIFFIHNNQPETYEGLNLSAHVGDGYILALQSGSKGPSAANSITLEMFGGTELGMKTYSTPISGSHHIDITRTPEGKFNVFFDRVDFSTPPIINVTKTTYTMCETFSFGSWIGDSGLDNFTIDNEVLPTASETTTTTTTTASEATTTTTTTKTTPGLEAVVIILNFFLIFILKRKRRH